MRTGVHRSKEKGQAIVETALSLMLVAVLLAGMVDFGMAFGYRVAVANAARAGARWGSRYPRQEHLVVDATIDALRGTLVLANDYSNSTPDANLSIAIACEVNGTPINCTVAERGQQIRVTVGYRYEPTFARMLGMTELPINASVLMYVLGPDQL